MKKSNDMASMQIFLSNNLDIRNSNTLDLHGLYVKEAIEVLKNVMNEKKTGIGCLYSIRKKSQTNNFNLNIIIILIKN